MTTTPPQVGTTISLKTGDNYISFPAISTSSFGELFFTGLDSIDAKVEKDSNGKRSFFKYNPIPIVSQDPWEYVNDYDYIEKGSGYYIKMIADGEINYSGVKYSLTFDQVKSKLMEGITGWNLVGPGYTTISIPNWCRVIDPTTRFTVTQLSPTQAYWIYFNDCQRPTPDPLVLIFSLGLIVSIISLLLTLRGKETGSDESIV